jgi:hypothetical protein
VQLAGCLARQLAQLVAIGDMRKSSKNQIRTHCEILLRKKLAPAGTKQTPAAQKGCPVQQGFPNYNSQGLDARVERKVQNPDALSQNLEKALRRISDTDCSLGDYPFCIPVPAVIKTAHRDING